MQKPGQVLVLLLQRELVMVARNGFVQKERFVADFVVPSHGRYRYVEDAGTRTVPAARKVFRSRGTLAKALCSPHFEAALRFNVEQLSEVRLERLVDGLEGPL